MLSLPHVIVASLLASTSSTFVNMSGALLGGAVPEMSVGEGGSANLNLNLWVG